MHRWPLTAWLAGAVLVVEVAVVVWVIFIKGRR